MRLQTDSIADQWQSKLEEFGVVLVCHVAITQKIMLERLAVITFSKSVTTDSDAFLSLPVELNSE